MASDGKAKLQRRKAEGVSASVTHSRSSEHAIWRSQVKLKGVAGDTPKDVSPDTSIEAGNSLYLIRLNLPTTHHFKPASNVVI